MSLILVGVAIAYLVGTLVVLVLPSEALLTQCGLDNWAVRPAMLLCLAYSAGAIYTRSRSEHQLHRNEGGRKQRALLVIAHPDDEAMFFGPLLRTIKETHSVHVLCLCTGNYDGLGNIRVPELHASCKVLVPRIADVMVVDDVLMPDGPKAIWPKEVVGAYVAQYVADHAIDQVYTFDPGGVSGHCNHGDVARGVHWVLTEGSAGTESTTTTATAAATAAASISTCHAPAVDRRRKTMPKAKPRKGDGGNDDGDDCVEAYAGDGNRNVPGTLRASRARPAIPSAVAGYALRTTSVGKKYLGVIDAACLSNSGDELTFFSTPEDIEAIWHAMVAHASQFVWFRRLYLWFSRYVYVNTFDRIV